MKNFSFIIVALFFLCGAGYCQTNMQQIDGARLPEIENANSFKIASPNVRAPKGMVNVTLQVGDVIPDGFSGFQMLLDPSATAYGTVFPASGYLSYNCQVAQWVFDAFAFKIPVNAEPICTTPNILFNNSITIQITAGTYDYAIVSPIPEHGYWSIVTGDNGRKNDYVFEEGYHYTFSVVYQSITKVQIIIEEDIPEIGKPGAVANLTVTPDHTDPLTVAIHWVNPSETAEGETLTDLIAIKLYENFGATPIYTDTNPVIGGADSYTLTVPASGAYTFMVVGENSVGEGIATTATVKLCSKISSFPYEEGFEVGAFAACWEQEQVEGTVNWVVAPHYNGTPGTAHEGTSKAIFYSNARGSKTKLITPPIDLSTIDNPVLNFWHTQRMCFADMDKLRIFYKNSAAGEWILLIDYITEVYEWTERNIALPDKSSDYYIAFEGESQYAYGIMLDEIRIVDVVGLDGAALNLFGAAAPMVGEPFIFKAHIQNMAGDPLTNYTVKLIDDQNNVLAINDDGIEIGSMKSRMIPLHYTPTEEGTSSLRAILEMTGDLYPENDITPVLKINVQPKNQTFTGTVGTRNQVSNLMPFNFEYNLSRTQSVYFDHEIIGRPGAITQLQYFNNFAENFTGYNAEILQIWMANTTMSKLDTWLPETEFTLVWNAPLPLPAGQNTITISLPDPFIYEGENMVIMTNRPFHDSWTSSYNMFYITETPEFVNRSREYHDFVYEFQGHQQGNAFNYHPDIKMEIGLEGAGVTGTVTMDGITPVEGATVELLGNHAGNYLKRTTDANGNYSFGFLLNGNYQFKVTKLGHYDVTSNPLTVEINNGYVVDVTLPHLPTYAVSGKITGNNAPDGLAGVEIKLSGYNTYSVTSDTMGNYSIPNVYATKTYNIEAKKTGYVTCNSTVSLDDNNITCNLNLNEIAWGVGKPLVEISESNALVSWFAPGTFTEKNYVLDNGVANEGFYINENFDNSLGNKFIVEETGELTSIDIFGYEAPNNSNKFLTIDIYDEFQQWAGTSEPFVLKSNEWTNVPVGNIPYSGTFYVMVHWANSEGHSHYIGYDNTVNHADENLDMLIAGDGTWFNFHQLFWCNPGVFMIRAHANIFGKSVTYKEYARSAQAVVFSQTKEIQSVSRSTGTIVAPECTKLKSENLPNSFEKYRVYRLTENQPESEWVLLSDHVTETSFTDTEWKELSNGVYQYAVKVKYSGDVVSVARLTNKIKNKMEYDYQINITSNSGDPATGAVVRLTHQDGNPAHDYTAVSAATGVTIPQAWLGTYNLKITLEGHVAYTNVITITNAGESHTATLTEIITAPCGLEIDTDCEAKSALFGWNKYQPFFDDVENYPDFIIEEIGDYTLYDFNGDYTYGVNSIGFPNAFAPHAFMVFHPLKTSPPMDSPIVEPLSGKKYLVSFAPTEGANDSWLILPKLRITDGTKFTFWARSFSLLYPERIKVLVSTTGVNAPADFKLLSKESCIDLPETWTFYSFNLEEYSRQEIYLAIHCVSEDGFFMMLDDISVDVDSKSKSFNGYKVYLDGKEMETTSNNEFLFTNIDAGTHTAGVKAVYSSGESEMATINFEGCYVGIDNTGRSALHLFPNPFTHEIHISEPHLVKSVQIKDLAGQHIHNVFFNGKSIVTKNLCSGIYMVVIETRFGEQMIYKMIKN